jgi:chromosome segregation ATPase
MRSSYTAPVGNTCPDIDKVVDAIKESQKSISAILNHIGELQSFDEYTTRQEILQDNIADEASNIDNGLWRLEDELEELRSANSALRDWGEELASECEELEKELEKVAY